MADERHLVQKIIAVAVYPLRESLRHRGRRDRKFAFKPHVALQLDASHHQREQERREQREFDGGDCARIAEESGEHA